MSKVYIYDSEKTTLLHIYTLEEFKSYSNMNKYKLNTYCYSGIREKNYLWLDKYFLTGYLLPEADNSLSSDKSINFFSELALTEKSFNPKIPTIGKTVYRYDDTDAVNLIEIQPSLRHCVKVLHGDRNYNTQKLELCIKYGELYEGFKVSFTPLHSTNT